MIVEWEDKVKLYFKQKALSVLDSYDVCDESGRCTYTAKRATSLGRSLKIYDSNRILCGRVRERALDDPRGYDIYKGSALLGRVCKQRISPYYSNAYHVISDHYTTEGSCFVFDHNGWRICSDRYESVYLIFDRAGEQIARISKNESLIADQYLLEVESDDDALLVVMMTLVIDADKDRRGK